MLRVSSKKSKCSWTHNQKNNLCLYNLCLYSGKQLSNERGWATGTSINVGGIPKQTEKSRTQESVPYDSVYDTLGNTNLIFTNRKQTDVSCLGLGVGTLTKAGPSTPGSESATHWLWGRRWARSLPAYVNFASMRMKTRGGRLLPASPKILHCGFWRTRVSSGARSRQCTRMTHIHMWANRPLGKWEPGRRGPAEMPVLWKAFLLC